MLLLYISLFVYVYEELRYNFLLCIFTHILPGSSSKLQTKTGDGPSSYPCSSVVQKPGPQGRPATSGSSREQSDDDDLEGETEGTDNMDPADAKRVRR